MIWLDIITTLLIITGFFFFLAGSVGLLRFPDLISRMHALTKADNVGLACIAIAVAINTSAWMTGLKILLIWLIVLIASSLMSGLIAQRIPKPEHIHTLNSRSK